MPVEEEEYKIVGASNCLLLQYTVYSEVLYGT